MTPESTGSGARSGAPRKARAVAERLRAHIEALDMTHWFPARDHITASIGAAVSAPGKDTLGETEPAAQDVNSLVVDG